MARDTTTNPPRPLPAHIIVACVGNICRSPMAHGLLLLALRERGLPVKVTSAGTNACVGMPADPLALRLMAERGIDIGAHRGAQLLPATVGSDTQLLVMAQDQADWVARKRRSLKSSVALLGCFTGGDIADPVHGTRHDFEQALSAIEAGIDAWLKRGWLLPDAAGQHDPPGTATMSEGAGA